MKVVCTAAVEDRDGRPVPSEIRRGCGLRFEVEILDGDPGLSETWDVKTNANGDVIYRTKEVTCPECGTGTFVVGGA